MATLTRRACLTVVGCLPQLVQCGGGPTGPSVALNEEFVVSPGDTVQIADTGARLHFVRVISDSRCPIDVVCVQAGDATVRIEILSPDETAPFDLHTADTRAVMHRSLAITLIRLIPSLVSTRTIGPDEYRATLRVPVVDPACRLG